MILKPFFTLPALLGVVNAITVYGVGGVSLQSISTTASASASMSAVPAGYTPPAFKTVMLTPPPVPSPLPSMSFTVELQNSADNVPGLSIPQSGAFYGFSIEMSIVNQVIGVNSTYLKVPFLNLMALITERAGHVNIRVGGNSQDTATLVDSLPGGVALLKDQGNSSSPTQTPVLLFTPEIIYMLANVSSLVNAKWYLGIPMNDTTNPRLQIAETSEAILGDNLIGLQLGNEPDLYASHGHRPTTYSPADYFGEFGNVIQAIGNDNNIPVKKNLIAPSVASGSWKPEDVWNTGFLQAYSDSLDALAVEHYPDNNCAAVFPDGGFGVPTDPQTVFPNYLNHTSGVHLVEPYLNSTAIAQSVGKPFIMFETNTASCGGFPGLSDSFGAALWALDYGLQMAYGNFSGALLHVGGSDAVYNPFTPPPTNESTFHSWTVGSVFYSSIVMAEALGRTNTSRVIDLQMNGGDIYTPGYAIYESGNLARLALFNYITDSSGASSYTATISVGGGTTGQPNATPTQVIVKYLLAPSVSDKSNITWAGQTLGAMFQADGRFQGNVSTSTVNCDQTTNTCNIKVPAPGFALVFLTSSALQEVTPQSPMTFSTSALTRTVNTVTVDPSALATSNGENGSSRKRLGSSSRGSVSSGKASMIAPGMTCLVTILSALWSLFGLFRQL